MRKSSWPSDLRGRPGPKRPSKPWFSCSARTVSSTLRPVHAERRVGDAVVEALAPVPVLGERVAVDDVAGVLALDEHVGQADRVGLGVELLAVEAHDGLAVEAVDLVLGLGEHAAGAAGAVEDGADGAGLAQHLLVAVEQEVDHQLDDLARGEVLAGGLVGRLGEAADQLLEDGAHVGVRDAGGMQVDVADARDDLVEQVGVLRAGRCGCRTRTCRRPGARATSSRRCRSAGGRRCCPDRRAAGGSAGGGG